MFERLKFGLVSLNSEFSFYLFLLDITELLSSDIELCSNTVGLWRICIDQSVTSAVSFPALPDSEPFL